VCLPPRRLWSIALRDMGRRPRSFSLRRPFASDHRAQCFRRDESCWCRRLQSLFIGRIIVTWLVRIAAEVE